MWYGSYLLKGFHYYLMSRLHCVMVNVVSAEVLQGSALVQLLFTLYMSDIPKSTNCIKVVLYAHDTNWTSLIRSFNSRHSLNKDSLDNVCSKYKEISRIIGVLFRLEISFIPYALLFRVGAAFVYESPLAINVHNPFMHCVTSQYVFKPRDVIMLNNRINVATITYATASPCQVPFNGMFHQDSAMQWNKLQIEKQKKQVTSLCQIH